MSLSELNALDGRLSVMTACDTSEFLAPNKQHHEHNP